MQNTRDEILIKIQKYKQASNNYRNLEYLSRKSPNSIDPNTLKKAKENFDAFNDFIPPETNIKDIKQIIDYIEGGIVDSVEEAMKLIVDQQDAIRIEENLKRRARIDEEMSSLMNSAYSNNESTKKDDSIGNAIDKFFESDKENTRKYNYENAQRRYAQYSSQLNNSNLRKEDREHAARQQAYYYGEMLKYQK